MASDAHANIFTMWMKAPLKQEKNNEETGGSMKETYGNRFE